MASITIFVLSPLTGSSVYIHAERGGADAGLGEPAQIGPLAPGEPDVVLVNFPEPHHTLHSLHSSCRLLGGEAILRAVNRPIISEGSIFVHRIAGAGSDRRKLWRESVPRIWEALADAIPR